MARLAAKSVGPTGSVIGLDLNPGMLAVTRAVSAGLPIEWREWRAESLPFQDATFTIVYCQLGLQFVADKAKAAHEMYRRTALLSDVQAALTAYETAEGLEFPIAGHPK